MPEMPEKSQYKLSEVCQFTDTQPYVLRFWESEFPQLRPEKTRSGQSVYSRDDVETVLRIKELLEHGDQSIADVREMLDAGSEPNSAAASAKAVTSAKSGRGRASTTARRKKTRPRLELEAAIATHDAQDRLALEAISNERYQNALDEIAHMRLQLNDADARQRRADQVLKKAEEANKRLRARSDRARAIIDEVIDGLS